MSQRTATPRRVTLKDIAKELDLSHATVSRALNRVDDSLISEATRDRVKRTAERLGYRPNLAGRTLVTGKTGLLALWLWSEGEQTSYQAMVSRLMYHEARARGYQIIVDLVGQPDTETHPNNSFDPWSVDGVLAHESSPAILAHLSGDRRPPVPLVATGSYNLLPDADRVIIDVGEGARQAMRHLVDGGRKKILYVTEDLRGRKADPRYQVYREILEEAGLPLFFADLSSDRATVRRGIRDYIAANGCPDALYCHNDDMAIGAYRALCDLGIRVPDDIAIVGFDGIEDTEYLEVPLTTVVLPLAEMCALAFQFLERRIEDPSFPPQEAVLQSCLSIRPSSGGSPTFGLS